MPLVSIIVPIYNSEKYLKQCMDSLLDQTLRDIEIIAVDDVSTDSSLKILEDYQRRDPRVIIVKSDSNEWVAATRNKGIDIASSEYIAFVDSDDWVDINRYERLLYVAKKNNADAVYEGYVWEYGDGKARIKRITTSQTVLAATEMLEMMCDNKISTNGPWQGIYRTSIIKNNLIRFQTMRSEDYVFNLEFLAEATKITLTPEIAYHYRVSHDSCSRGYISNESPCSFRGVVSCAVYLKSSSRLRKYIPNYDRFINKYMLNECGISALNITNRNAPESFSERIAFLRKIATNELFIHAYNDKVSLSQIALRKRQLLSNIYHERFNLLVIYLYVKGIWRSVFQR